ncbi:MAG: hypothetical protein KDB22_21810, partial [Planctomycetales bacterium]|nr:hypothetical protein [Planctomycetales bacterium]
MKRRNEDDATVGEDSFLDTTANLVGVLIILVVVIGTKTQIDAQAYGKQLAEQTPNVAGEVVAEVKALRGALEDQSRQTQAYEFESAYRSLERSRLLEEVALRQEENDQLLNQLDDQERTQIEQQHA